MNYPLYDDNGTYDVYGLVNFSHPGELGYDLGEPVGGEEHNIVVEADASNVDHATNVWRVTLSLIICVVGLLGNLLAIFLILVLKEFQKSITHWYVLQLALADSIFLLTLPFKVSEELNHAWIFPEWMCKAKETILFLNYYASILFLMVMSLDRYIAVCHTFSGIFQKLRSKEAATIITIVTWIVSLLLCIPVMMFSFKIGTNPNCRCSYEFPSVQLSHIEQCRAEGFEDGGLLELCLSFAVKSSQEVGTEKYCKTPLDKTALVGELLNGYDEVTLSSTEYGNYEGVYKLKDSNDTSDAMLGGANYEIDPDEVIDTNCHYWDRPLGWIAFIVFNFVVMFLVPLFVLVICYGLILRRISNRPFRMTRTPSNTTYMTSQPSGKRKSSGKSDRDRTRMTVMCAILVGTFVVCWLPFHAVHLAKIAGIKVSLDNKDICTILPVVGAMLAYLNSALNPYLYSFLGTKFSRRWDMAMRKSFRRGSSSSSSSVFARSVQTRRKKPHREGSSNNPATSITRINRHNVSEMNTHVVEGKGQPGEDFEIIPNNLTPQSPHFDDADNFKGENDVFVP
ncbi:somatostatin receptor type 2-like [Clavelina lepadiformis]|uniref:G-protein coupled receptors family 1 profile domain-containing protein n=1 Tax=Clavelina lepadiformis TaxID=159417 RepID=A0ABP0GNC9_CLALP